MMTSLTGLSAPYIAFQSVAAGLIPVLLIAYAFQLGVKRIWEEEEPIYRAVFPYYIGAITGLMVVGEITAVSALLLEADNSFCRLVPLAAIVVPMFYIALGVISEAEERRADFDWARELADWEARGQRRSNARDARRARRRAGRAGVKKSFARRPIPRPSLADVLLGLSLPLLSFVTSLWWLWKDPTDPTWLVLTAMMAALLAVSTWFWVWRPFLTERLERFRAGRYRNPEASAS